MPPAHLSFEEIHIRRMPGFEDGGFPVEPLAAGINVIYGPNGSGKTTISKAIQHLLALDSRKQSPFIIGAALEIDGDRVTVEYDYGDVRCQQDGIPIASAPQLAPVEAERHCILALHDLIETRDGGDLAAEVIRRTAGGFDLAAARDSLQFRDRPRTKGALHRKLAAATDSVRQARAKQVTLARSEDQLEQLREKRSNARAAKKRLEQIEKWKRVLDARESVNRAQTKLSSFPNEMENVIGNESEQLARFQHDLDNAHKQKDAVARALVEAKQTLDQSPLPLTGVEPTTVGALRQKCSRLRDVRNEFHQLEASRAATAARAMAAARKLGEGITLEHAQRLDTQTLGKVFKLVRIAEKVRGQWYAKDSLQRWLGQPEAAGDAEVMREGAHLLERWLAANVQRPESRPTDFVPWIVAGLLLTILGGVFAFFVHTSILIFLFVGIGLIIWPFIQKRFTRTPYDPIHDIERAFSKLKIGNVEQWTDESVREMGRRLHRSLATAMVETEKRLRWAELADDVKQAQEDKKQIDSYRRKLREKLGIEINVDEETLSLLVSNLVEWSKADLDLTEMDAKVKNIDGLRADYTNDLNTALNPFGFESADDPESLEAQIERLTELRETHANALKDIGRCNNQLEQLDNDIRKCNEAIEHLFDKLSLDPDNELELHRFVDLHEDFSKARTEVTNSEAVLHEHEEACNVDASIRGLVPDQLEDARLATEEIAFTFDRLNDEIIGIEKEVEIAKKAHDVEQALAEKQDYEIQLRQQRDDDYISVAGHLISDWLSKEQQEREQPRVMRRAKELFVRFTHGRYQLLVEGGDAPSFRALDTSRNVGQALEELSSGTRLQLLLAAHMAFVEEHEGQYRLPLVFDETLGNSDERRAREIIDAAIEICRTGRQVFYLTAQRDEVGKWRSIIRKYDDVPYREIDLAEVRHFSEEERMQHIAIDPPPQTSIPEPGDNDWIRYGKLLDVPAIQPLHDIGAVHLWYVVHDPHVLYRLLQGGINRWGQLTTLVRYHAPDGIDHTSRIFRQAAAAANVVESACRLLMIGRGKPVDREVINQSSAVSDTFVNDVMDLLNESNGSASALLKALDDGRISGFRSSKKQQLRRHLLDNGFLDERNLLTKEELVTRVATEAFPYVDEGLIESGRVEQLVTAVVADDIVEVQTVS